MSAAQSIAVVGCGVQGTALIERLLAAGHEVLAHDVLEVRTQRAHELGARAVMSAPRALEQAQRIALVLPAGRAVLEWLSAPGVLEALRGREVVQMGSISLEDTRTLAARLEEVGAELTECVLCGPMAAILEGKCPLLVGGSAEQHARLGALFWNVGTALHVGPLGSASVFNLAVLSVLYPVIHGFGEASAMIERSGLSLEQWLGFVGEGGLLSQAGMLLTKFLWPAHFARRSYPLIGPMQFRNASALAETEMMHAQARRLGLRLELFESIREAHAEACRDDPDADWSSVYEHLVPLHEAMPEGRVTAPAPLQVAVTAEARAASRPAAPRESLTVALAMNARVATIAPGATVREAAELMVLTQSSDLVVRERGGRFLGVLSEGDVIRAVLPDLDEVQHAAGSLEAAGDLFIESAARLGDQPIARLVIRTALTLAPDDDLLRAATLMTERMIRRLPVVDDGRVVGTLSRADLCWALMLEAQQRQWLQRRSEERS